MIENNYSNNNVILSILRKNCCPKCGTEFSSTTVSKTVNQKAPNTKNFKFTLSDTFIVCNEVSIRREYQCSVCKRKYIINEIKETKKSQKIQVCS